MSRNEDHILSTIDRRRDRGTASARTIQVRASAVEAVNAFVTSLPEEDRCDAMNAAIRHLRTLYGSGEGEREAVSLFGSLAWSATLQARAAVARATAEQAMARLTNHANDEDPR